MRDAFIDELLKQARLDPSVMLVVGDLGYGVVESFAHELPLQFLNAGVAEQNMVGVAAGLAAGGYRVFVYSIANFPTLRCLEQIRNDVCYHGLDVTIVSVGAGVSYGTLGYTHHALEDISVMRALPKMRVMCPSDPWEARQSVHECLERGGPTYVRLGKNGERQLHPFGTTAGLEEPLVLRDGSDVAIVATGSIAGACLEAAEILDSIGVTAAVLSCPTVKPLSQEWLRSLSGTSLVSVEEHSLTGGFGSAILEGLSDLAIDLRMVRVGVRESRLTELGSADYLRDFHGLSPGAIVEAAKSVLQ